MNNQIDFLKPGVKQIRHQIKSIVESYNHDWDLIAELAQNSVDAITLQKPIRGRIELTVLASERKIIFKDNGCGISPDDLPDLLTPFSSGKYGDDSLIGQKGVGISFVIFCSAYFSIESHHDDGASRASIYGAAAWIDSQAEDLPKLNFERIEHQENSGTQIVVKLPDNSDYEFFKHTFDQLALVLRTRTAIGDVRTIWGQISNKSILLSLTDLNGDMHTEEFDCSYFLPISNLRQTEHISLREFQEWNSVDRTDTQKRSKLRNRLIYHHGETVRSGRTIKYWACFVPRRSVWDVVSVNSNLVSEDILNLNPTQRLEKYGKLEFLFSGGMHTATRGMPTGIRSDLIAKGWAGYLPNFFIVLEDPILSFDIGRKSIPSRQLGMLREIANDVFVDIIKVISKYIGGEPEIGQNGWDRTAVFNEIRSLPKLKSSKTKFTRRPSSQEATIAAIFFELLGSGEISNIKPYISGYKNKYDLYARYKNSDVVIEFKYALGSLFRDFDDEKKLFDEINIVVVWEVTEHDREVIESRGLSLEENEHRLESNIDSLFHYSIVASYVNPIYVVCLSKLI